MKDTVLVVGASGFVGRAVCLDLLRRGYLRMDPATGLAAQRAEGERAAPGAGDASAEAPERVSPARGRRARSRD